MTEVDPSIPMFAADLAAVAYSLWIVARARTKTAIATSSIVLWGGVLASWAVVLHLALSSNNLFPADIPGPVFLGLVFAFVGLVGVAVLSRPVRRALSALSQADLLQLQGIRVFFGAGFLAMAAVGVLPATFGILDGFTHVTAGFLGLLAAQRLTADASNPKERASGRNWGRIWAWIANLFGLADILIVASTISLVLLPEITPHHSMMYAVFLPAPLWLWFHVVSIARSVRGDR